MEVLLIIAALAWIPSGLLSHGACLGWFTWKYPDQYHGHLRLLLVGLYILGPLGLIISLPDWPGSSRLRWTFLSEDERWKHFRRLYPAAASKGRKAWRARWEK